MQPAITAGNIATNCIEIVTQDGPRRRINLPVDLLQTVRVMGVDNVAQLVEIQPSFRPTKTLSASPTTLGKLKVHACQDVTVGHFETAWDLQVKAPRSFYTSSYPRKLESSGNTRVTVSHLPLSDIRW